MHRIILIPPIFEECYGRRKLPLRPSYIFARTTSDVFRIQQHVVPPLGKDLLLIRWEDRRVGSVTGQEGGFDRIAVEPVL